MRCVDVAALFAAAILRRNPDSIAERLSKFGGGGTDCSLPIVEANTRYAKRKFAGIVLVSDNEGWVGAGRGGSTAVMSQWASFTSNQQSVFGKTIHKAPGASNRIRCILYCNPCKGIIRLRVSTFKAVSLFGPSRSKPATLVTRRR